MKRNKIMNLINEMKSQNNEAKDLLSIELQKEVHSSNPNFNKIRFIKKDIHHFRTMNFGLTQLQEVLEKEKLQKSKG